MTNASAWSVALNGMDGQLVEVEAALGAGLPKTVLVGLPDTALYEARDRCRAAATATGLGWPSQLLTINLTPASLPKAGSHYDLAIMAAVLVASGAAPAHVSREAVLLGELGLDGRVRRVRGVLPALLVARDSGRRRAIVPACQEAEARLVEGLEIWGVATLDELVEALNGRPVLPRPGGCDEEAVHRWPEQDDAPDLSDVVGQPEGRWALEVAAAGGHHLFLHGAPGLGKTMLAMRLPGLLPDLGADEALEVSALRSLAGEDLGGQLIRRPPFADPHYNATLASMVGGGSRLARPGAISLAHRGVLFLDEAPEFSPRVLDALRTPLESGTISIARSQGMVRFPARFQLVLAANPCPCGQSGTPGALCQCTPMAVRRYRERISGPIVDRIDIHQHLMPVRVSVASVLDPSPEPTAVVAQRVAAARDRSRARLAGTGWMLNAEVPGGVVRKSLPAPRGTRVLDDALAKGRISARGVDKVARISWTLADLAGHDRIDEDDLAAAMGLHGGEWWGV